LGIELVVVILMVAMNAVFAGYEIALASVSGARLKALTRGNHFAAGAAVRMKENMERSLAVLQLGMTLVGAIAAATSGVWASERIEPELRQMGFSPVAASVAAIALVVVPLTGMTILCGELMPKLFALRHKEWVCLRLSPMMQWVAISTRPFVWLLERVALTLMSFTERHWKLGDTVRSEVAELQELRAVAALARTARLIGAREENIILGAARLSSRPIRDIMLPTGRIDMLNVNDPVHDCLVEAHVDMHTRYPVTERAGDPQGIVGYVNFKDIVAHLRQTPREPSMRAIVRAIPILSAEAPIASGLESLLREHTHIAIVRADAGQILGMVTLEDILEELIGDIEDEYDVLPNHALAAVNGWAVGGGIGLSRMYEVTGIDLRIPEPKGVLTLSGWVVARLGRKVRSGDEVQTRDVKVTVRKARRGHVVEAQISRHHHLSSHGSASESGPPGCVGD
jgi:putative hemolysin